MRDGRFPSFTHAGQILLIARQGFPHTKLPEWNDELAFQSYILEEQLRVQIEDNLLENVTINVRWRQTKSLLRDGKDIALKENVVSPEGKLSSKHKGLRVDIRIEYIGKGGKTSLAVCRDGQS